MAPTKFNVKYLGQQRSTQKPRPRLGAWLDFSVALIQESRRRPERVGAAAWGKQSPPLAPG